MNSQKYNDYWPEGVKKTLKYPKITVQDLLDDVVEKNGERTYLELMGITYTFKDVNVISSKLANALQQEFGVKKGDRVGLLMPNVPQFVISFFAILKTGAYVVPISPLYGSKDLKKLLDDSGLNTLITIDLLYETLEEIREECLELKNVVVTSIGDLLSTVKRVLATIFRKLPKTPPIRSEDHDFFQLIENYDTNYHNVEINHKEVAILAYTGGTTGIPKGTMLTHFNLISNIVQANEWLRNVVDEEQHFIGSIPFFHMTGLTHLMLAAVKFHSTLHLVPNPRDIKMQLSLIEQFRPPFFTGVPTLFNSIYNHPKFKKYDLSGLKMFLSGAAPFQVELAKKINNHMIQQNPNFIGVVEGYGLTETSPMVSASPAERNKIKTGSVGLPMPDTTIKIVDLETKEIAERGKKGEICIKGPQVMQGYWENPEATKQTIDEDGFLHTGDIGFKDETGQLWIVDRLKDMINVSGFKVYPREVEELLYEHPAILEVSIIGVPDSKQGEAVKAIVNLKTGKKITQKELYEFCKGKIAKYKIPRQLEIWQDLPKTPIGKIDKRTIKSTVISVS